MSFYSHNDFNGSNHQLVNSRGRMDFSGIFGSSQQQDGKTVFETPAGRRRRPREISPLQFESDFDDMDSKEEMSMEALHFFGLSTDRPSTPVTPKFFDSDETQNIKKRQRHFSLEDYNAMDESEDSSSSSNLSNISVTSSISSKRVRQGSVFFSGFDDSGVSLSQQSSPQSIGTASSSSSSFVAAEESPKSDLDFFSNRFFSNKMSLELDNDHINVQLRSELEARLLETLCPTPGTSSPKIRRKVSLEVPPQLLSIIAAHIIQEASCEPYGLKGCILHIYYESETDCEYWASLDCDPETLPTFELTLTLRQDTCGMRGWRNKLPELVRNFSAFGFCSVLIGTSYKLVKQRNYRTNVQEKEVSLLKM